MPRTVNRPVVLVIDEHEDSRIIIRTIALHAGLDVTEAPDGFQGINLARQRCPSLIVMDLDMRRVSGFDALRVLRMDRALRHVPVIATSANFLEAEAGAAGFDAFIRKPIAVPAMARELLRLTTPLDA